MLSPGCSSGDDRRRYENQRYRTTSRMRDLQDDRSSQQAEWFDADQLEALEDAQSMKTMGIVEDTAEADRRSKSCMEALLEVITSRETPEEDLVPEDDCEDLTHLALVFKRYLNQSQPTEDDSHHQQNPRHPLPSSDRFNPKELF